MLEGDNNEKQSSMENQNEKTERFSIQLSSTSNIAEKVDIEVCVQGCKSLFPYQVFSHFGVRWDETNANIECWCLMSNAFDSSMIGPQVKALNVIRIFFLWKKNNIYAYESVEKVEQQLFDHNKWIYKKCLFILFVC